MEAALLRVAERAKAATVTFRTLSFIVGWTGILAMVRVGADLLGAGALVGGTETVVLMP